MERFFSEEKLCNALGKDYFEALKVISDYSNRFGTKIYIIGGAVRDLLPEKPIYDLDLVVEGNAVEFCEFTQSAQVCKIIRTTEEFGTAKIELNNNIQLDLASTRTETYPKPGHLPQVQELGCSLKEDILRRDFTINALAVSLNKGSFGELIDFVEGVEDLKSKKLRILHNKSFIDDPTRILRALRFKYKLGFAIENHTKKLQDEYIKNFDNNDICYERIKQVLKLALNMNNPDLYDEFISEKLYKLVCGSTRGIRGAKIHEAICENIKIINPDNIWLVYLSCITDEDLSYKLNLSAKERHIQEALNLLLSKNPDFKSNFSIYNFFKSAPVESVLAYRAITGFKEPQKFLTDLKDIKLSLDGQILLELGFEEGKNIGQILLKIFEEKINGKITTKQDEIDYALSLRAK